MFKKGDILLILFITLTACLLIAWNNYSKRVDSGHKISIITHDGEVIKKLDLDRLNSPEYVKINDRFKIDILAEKNRIRFLDANCPDKICIKTGWLSKNGDQAICIPSKTMIKIENNKPLTDANAY